MSNTTETKETTKMQGELICSYCVTESKPGSHGACRKHGVHVLICIYQGINFEQLHDDTKYESPLLGEILKELREDNKVYFDGDGYHPIEVII